METWEKLYSEGKYIHEILDELKISKATLYRRLKKKGIVRKHGEALKGRKHSEERKQKIREALKGKNTGETRWNTQKLNDDYDKITDDLAYILGTMFGDGYLLNGGIGLQTKDSEFAEEFALCITKQFGTRINRYETEPTTMKDWRNGKTYNRSRTFIVRTMSVMVHDFIEKTQKLSVIQTLTLSQKLSFLRGLWDSEGSISISGYTNCIRFTHKTKELCDVYADLVNELCGFRPKIRQNKHPYDVFNAYFYKKEYIRKFYDIVNPTIYRKRIKFESII